MKLIMWLFAAYLLFINLDALLLMRSDKRRAREGRRRVPEATLFAAAVLGGGPGILLGMKKYRHKTLHTSFTVGIPLIIFFEAALLALAALFSLRAL